MHERNEEKALLIQTIEGLEQLMSALLADKESDRIALITYFLAMAREEAYSGLHRPKLRLVHSQS